MSHSRKSHRNARESKSASTSKKGSQADPRGQPSKLNGKASWIGVIALVLLVGSIGFFWLDRNRNSDGRSGSRNSDADSLDSKLLDRRQSLERLSKEELEQYLQLPELEPDRPRKIDIEMWTKQLDRDLGRLLQLLPNDAKAEHLVGLVNLRLKRTKQAEPNLQRAVQLDPSNPQMRYDLADLLLQVGRDNEALQTLAGIGRTVSNPRYLWLTSECQMRQGQLAEARQSLSLAAELAPNDAEIWVRLGRLQLQQLDFESARQSAARATELDERSLDGWLLLSQSNKFLKNAEQATKAMQRWQQLNVPRQHHTEDRDFELENSLSMAKVFSSAYRSLGSIYEDRAQLAIAAQMYDRASEVGPTDLENVLAKANLFRRTSQFTEASELIRRAIRLQPTEYSHYQNLANLSMEQKSPKQAEATLRLACLAMPENGRVHLTLARFLLLVNKPAEAVGPAETAQRLLNSVEAEDVLSQVLTAAGVLR